MDYIFYHFLHYSITRFSFLLIILLGTYTLYLIKLVNKNSDYKNKNYFMLYEKAINILLVLHVLLSLIDCIINEGVLGVFYLIVGVIGVAIIYGLFYMLSKNSVSIAKPKEFYKKILNINNSTSKETTPENNNQPQINKSFKLVNKSFKLDSEESNIERFLINIVIAIGIIIGILFTSWILWNILKNILENSSFSYYDYESLLQFIPISIIAFILLIITFLTFMIVINSKLNVLLKREDKINKIGDKNKNDTV